MGYDAFDLVNQFKMESLPQRQMRQAQNALQQIEFGERMRTLDNRNALSAIGKQTTDPAEMARLYQQQTGDVQGTWALQDRARQEATQARDDRTAILNEHRTKLQILADSSKLVNESNYGSWRDGLIKQGLAAPTDLPESYDRGVVRALQGKTDEGLKEIELLMPGGKKRQLMMRGDEVMHDSGPVERWQPRRPGAVKPMQVFDPTSPTGTRFVRPEDAIGQPGKPPSKVFAITGYDSEGRPLIEMGGAGGGNMGTAARNAVEQRILDSGDTMSQVAAIRARFRPEFQQIGTRWDALKASWKLKAGLDLDADSRQRLQDFSAYRAESGQMFSNILRSLSGTAVTDPEMRRAEAWLPNPGTGLFDGDDPAMLESKLNRLEDFTRKALAKNSYVRRHGLDIGAIDVEQMPSIMQRRGDELAQELAAQGVHGGQLKSAVKQRLADEFGLSVYSQ